MKTVVSASRRTDLVAFFPEWLSSVLDAEKARVLGPSGHAYTVDLRPESVHTVVLWSKNFANLIDNRAGLAERLRKYDQVYLHFTITGLGGTLLEQGVPGPRKALSQIKAVVDFVGNPERISLRFDPVVYWREADKIRTNLDAFEGLAPEIHRQGIRTLRLSFAQWYRKALRRFERQGLEPLDPPEEKKLEAAARLVRVARKYGFRVFACSQAFLTRVDGIHPSSCIDGALLQALHPAREPASLRKDRTQRPECGCTESLDIGSYTQSCPHSCLYCYANPRL